MLQQSVFAFALILPAFAQHDVIEVVRVEDVMPLLSSLMNSARLGSAVEQIVEMVPKGNLQGGIGNGMSNLLRKVEFPLSSGAAGGATLIKEVSGHIPVIGSLLPSLGTYIGLKENPEVPTLAPATPPEPLSRMAADLGIKTAATKNTIAAVASIPAQAIASRASQLSNSFNSKTNALLGTPAQINQLLQFQHSLFESYLAGMNQANNAVPPQTLRNELQYLSMMQPQLSALLERFNNPSASGTLTSLDRMFGLVMSPTETSEEDESSVANVAESLLLDPTSMKLALANVALNFLEAVTAVESDAPAMRVSSED